MGIFGSNAINEASKNIKVFLGGTCGKSTWRDEIIPKLNIDYFNPNAQMKKLGKEEFAITAYIQ